MTLPYFDSRLVLRGNARRHYGIGMIYSPGFGRIAGARDGEKTRKSPRLRRFIFVAADGRCSTGGWARRFANVRHPTRIVAVQFCTCPRLFSGSPFETAFIDSATDAGDSFRTLFI